jgi:hypothetical protein
MAKPTDIVKTASMSAAILDAGTATAAPDTQPKTEAQAPWSAPASYYDLTAAAVAALRRSR